MKPVGVEEVLEAFVEPANTTLDTGKGSGETDNVCPGILGSFGQMGSLIEVTEFKCWFKDH